MMWIDRLKQDLRQIKDLMMPFKWYIAANLVPLIIFFTGIFHPLKADSPDADGMSELEIRNENDFVVMVFIMLTLLLLLGTSNMRNHPRIAKFCFLLPWIVQFVALIVIIAIDSIH